MCVIIMEVDQHGIRTDFYNMHTFYTNHYTIWS